MTLLLRCVSVWDAISYYHMKVDNNIKYIYTHTKFMYRISQIFRVVWRHCAANRGLVLTDCAPADAQCNNNVIATPKRRSFDVIMTLLLRCVSVGTHSVITTWRLTTISNIYIYTHPKFMYRISQRFRVVWRQRYCAANRGLVLTDWAPADAQHNNNVIMTLLLHCVYVGTQSVITTWRLTTISNIYIYTHTKFMYRISQIFRVVWRHCAANRGLVLTDCAPADAQRNNNVIATPKRRSFDVIMTLLLRCVSVGTHSVITSWRLTTISNIYIYICTEYHRCLESCEDSVIVLRTEAWY